MLGHLFVKPPMVLAASTLTTPSLSLVSYMKPLKIAVYLDNSGLHRTRVFNHMLKVSNLHKTCQNISIYGLFAQPFLYSPSSVSASISKQTAKSSS